MHLKGFEDTVLAIDFTIFYKSQTCRSEFKDISKIGTFLNSKKMALQPREDLAIKMTLLLHKSSVSKRQEMPALPGGTNSLGSA